MRELAGIVQVITNVHPDLGPTVHTTKTTAPPCNSLGLLLKIRSCVTMKDMPTAEAIGESSIGEDVDTLAMG